MQFYFIKITVQKSKKFRFNAKSLCLILSIKKISSRWRSNFVGVGVPSADRFLPRLYGRRYVSGFVLFPDHRGVFLVDLDVDGAFSGVHFAPRGGQDAGERQNRPQIPFDHGEPPFHGPGLVCYLAEELSV